MNSLEIGAQRWRRAMRAALSSVALRLIGLATGFVVAPILLQNLGQERYGVYLTITGLTAFLAFSDAGIGNGVVNAVAEARGRADLDAERRDISAAFFTLLASAAVVLIVLEVLIFLGPSPQIIGVDSPHLAGMTRHLLAVFVALFLAGLPLSVVYKIQLGRQQQTVANGFAAAASLTTLGLVPLIALSGDRAVLVLLLIMGPGLIAAAADSAWTFRRDRHLRPRLTAFDRSDVNRMARVGGLFFVLGVAGTVAYETDNLVISHVLGPDRVPDYALPYRLFAMSPLLLWMLFTPLWPAVRDAHVRGDHAWVRQTFWRSVRLAAAINGACCLILVIAGNAVLRLWVGPQIHASHGLLLALAGWTMLNTVSGPVSVLLNAAGVVRFQTIAASAMATLNLALSIALTRSLGIVGPVLGSLLAQLVASTIPSLIYLYRSDLIRPASAEALMDVK